MIIDLCCGLKGFSQAFPQDEVVTIDIERKFKPSIIADVRYLPLKENLQPELLLMSPPCERNSIACPQWPKKGIRQSLDIVGACLETVIFLKPKYWLLENPKGRLRWFIGKPKQTINYSDFDMNYRAIKPTDLWGNLPLPMVKFQRPLKVGHVEKGWFRRGWNWDIPREDRSAIPLGVSLAVAEAVQLRKKD